MTSPGGSTFDGNPNATPPVAQGYRPGLDDGGPQLTDDPMYPPNPATDPTSAAWNYFRAMCASFGRMIPAASVAVIAGANPGVLSWATAANSVASNPFSVWRGAAGDYMITWSAIAQTWAATTAYTSAYAVGSFVVPMAAPSGFYYRCTTAGNSGAAEPVWPTGVGQTVNDGTCVWTCWGPILPVGLPLAGQPNPRLNVVGGTHSYGIQATYPVSGAVRVTIQQDAVLTDINFSVDLF